MPDSIPFATLQNDLPQPKSQGSASAVFAGFLGWMLDAFDFFLVVVCLKEIGAEFHKSEKQIALSLVVALAFGPLGALIFGFLADLYGRRLPLMIDLIFFSIIEILTGLAPNYTTFMILRVLFGIGMGGEWGVGASLAMEKVSPRWRGTLSGLLQEGYAMGYLLAAACSGLMLTRYGWRPLFFIGGLPALLALYVRFGVKESEVWEQTRHSDWASLGRGILSHWKIFLYLVLLMAAMNFSSHGTQDLYPQFLKIDHQFTPERAGWVLVVMQIGAVAGGVLFGLFSDRIGRRTAMVLAFFGAIAVIPLWAYSHSLVWIVTGAFLIQFMVQGAWGIIPAHISELSPDSVRGFLPGFAYQCGVLIAASVDWIQPVLTLKFGRPTAMANLALVIFACAGIIVGLGWEKKGIKFGQTPAPSANPASGFPVAVTASKV